MRLSDRHAKEFTKSAIANRFKADRDPLLQHGLEEVAYREADRSNERSATCSREAGAAADGRGSACAMSGLEWAGMI